MSGAVVKKHIIVLRSKAARSTNQFEPLIDIVVVVDRRVSVDFWRQDKVNKFKSVGWKGFYTQFLSTVLPILDVHLGGLLICHQPPCSRALAPSQPKRVIDARGRRGDCPVGPTRELWKAVTLSFSAALTRQLVV